MSKTTWLFVFMMLFSSMVYADADDDPSGATTISLNQEYTGNLSSNRDIDYYKFQLPNDGNVAVTLRHGDGDISTSTYTYWRGYLYVEGDLSNALHLVSIKGTPNTATFQEGLPAGTYYFKITDFDRYSSAQYYLKVDFEANNYYEKSPNHTPTTATTISLNQEYTGNLSSYRDIDYYKFQLPNDGNVAVTLRHEDGDISTSTYIYWREYLYVEGDLSNALHLVSIKGTPNTATFQEGLPAGTYYLKITDFDRYSPAQYYLKVETVAVGKISVTPSDGLNASGNQDGPFTPNSKSYTLTNTGGTSLSYSVSNTQSWVSLSNSSGTLSAGGSTTVTVSINSNANSLSPNSYADTVTFTNTTNNDGNTTRTVNLTVNALPCSYSITPTSRSHGSSAENGSVSITAPAGCNWTASSNTAWVTINSDSNGQGNGTVTYSVDANTTTQSRSGTLSIAGQTFTINQAGKESNQPPVANFTVSPTQGTAPLTVILDPSGSYDPDGTIVQYDWSINGQPASPSSDGNGNKMTLNTPGTYTIALTVTDNDGLTHQTQATVEVLTPDIRIEPSTLTFP